MCEIKNKREIITVNFGYLFVYGHSSVAIPHYIRHKRSYWTVFKVYIRFPELSYCLHMLSYVALNAQNCHMFVFFPVKLWLTCLKLIGKGKLFESLSIILTLYLCHQTMNPRNSACNEASLVKGVCVSQLRSKTASPSQILKSTPDRRLTMAFGFHEFFRQELYGTNMYKKYFGMIKNNFS